MDMEEFDNDIDWEDGPPDDGSFGPPFQPPPRSERYNRYNNAYGDYRGGYSPLGFGNSGPGFGPMGPMPGPPRPGPPFMFGRGFGPNGPPQRTSFKDDRHIRYLLRCGVPMEHVRNYPKDMLHLIQPENCGVCALMFNSFSSSRVHYTSKNHQKSVKKYISQRTSVGQSRKQGFAEAVPLKARELYCELCDVHITSKSHADSHYAGKNHHAIVEGRKQTKNPILLQRNMADRIDQLIRREKKHLKAMEKKEEDKPKTPSAPPDPELYCDICKTSVTCSDQMTMHLNGKKHLSKEKRHIFEKIKANQDDNEEEEYYEDDEGEEGEAGETGEGDAEDAGAGETAGGDQPAQDGGSGEWPDGEYDI